MNKESALEIAREVLNGKSRSYVSAAISMAKYLVEAEERLQTELSKAGVPAPRDTLPFLPEPNRAAGPGELEPEVVAVYPVARYEDGVEDSPLEVAEALRFAAEAPSRVVERRDLQHEAPTKPDAPRAIGRLVPRYPDAEPPRVPTDAAVVLREDFLPDVPAAKVMVEKTKRLLDEMKAERGGKERHEVASTPVPPSSLPGECPIAKALDSLELPTDPLHPTGRCTCAGEGRCEWCNLRTGADDD